ncbi:MAG: hypothetical protein GTO18_22080 [Anaerolineales bacterium]|nr:hypothetical protein [Anaerolineales bacterium]
MNQKHHRYLGSMMIIAITLMVALPACNQGSNTSTETEPLKAEPTEIQPAEPTDVPPTEVPAPTQEPTVELGLPPISAEPQRVEFQAQDGKNLIGYYFPAAVNPAPTVILMHWAGGDQRDWLAIAPWLQNRPDELAEFAGWAEAIGSDCGPQFEGPWLDPSWFPAMPPDLSFAVFTFDFRDFCESEDGVGIQLEWALDAKAAFETASELPGVDPHQMAAIGASIGADGAPDGCLLHNGGGETCLGAFSLSPGNYLTMIYADVIADLRSEEPPKPVWCLTAKEDVDSVETCLSASSDLYRTQIYDGDEHGMMLVTPEFVPNPMDWIQDFLEVVFSVEIN